MEAGDGTVQRWPLRRIYRGLCSSLRTTCSPVCRRVETSVFHRQSDGTTRCRGTVCPSGTYVRVIVRFHLGDEAITLQTNACDVEAKLQQSTLLMWVASGGKGMRANVIFPPRSWIAVNRPKHVSRLRREACAARGLRAAHLSGARLRPTLARSTAIPPFKDAPVLVDFAEARAGRVLSAERAAPTCCFEASLSVDPLSPVMRTRHTKEES